MEKIKLNDAIEYFRRFINESWNEVQKIASEYPQQWLDNWLQANFELIIEEYCNQHSKECVVLDFYGNGAEDFDALIPPNMRVSPQRVTFPSSPVTHTITCTPKDDRKILELYSHEAIKLTSDELVLGELVSFSEGKLQFKPEFNAIEGKTASFNRPIYILIADLDFWLTPISGVNKK